VNAIQASPSVKEINRRVREIKNHWNEDERVMRRVACEARCETLVTILVGGFEEIA